MGSSSGSGGTGTSLGTITSSLTYNSSSNETYVGSSSFTVGAGGDGSISTTTGATVSDIKNGKATSDSGTSFSTSGSWSVSGVGPQETSFTYLSSADASSTTSYSNGGSFTTVSSGPASKLTALDVTTTQSQTFTSDYSNQNKFYNSGPGGSNWSANLGTDNISASYTSYDHGALAGHSGNSTSVSNERSFFATTVSSGPNPPPSSWWSTNLSTGKYTPEGGQLTTVGQGYGLYTGSYSGSATTSYNGGTTPSFINVPTPDLTPLDGTNSQPNDVSYLVPNAADNIDAQAPNGTSGPLAAAAAGLGLSPTVVNYVQGIENGVTQAVSNGLQFAGGVVAAAPQVISGAASGAVSGAASAAQWVGNKIAAAPGAIYDATIGSLVNTYSTSYNNMRASGSGVAWSAFIAAADTFEQHAGGENFVNAYEGRTRDGTALSAGWRAWEVAKGLGNVVNTALEVIGAKAVAQGVYSLAKSGLSGATRFGLAEAPAVAESAAQAARLGGAELSEAELKLMTKNLAAQGIMVQQGADGFLASKGYAALFRSYSSGKGVLFLKSNPTWYEVLHELAHIADFKRLGPQVYNNLSILAREQLAYNALRNSAHWASFSMAEALNAIDYILSLGGTP